MNLLIIPESQISKDFTLSVRGRAAEHLTKIVQVGVGDLISVGILNGAIGSAEIQRLDTDGAVEMKMMQSSLRAPPPPVPCRVVLAMPRPKMMRRILQNLSCMGIKQIHLIHSWKVEKSFWQTPWLQPQVLEQQLILGLEQAVDTQLAEISIHKAFKPFVEDRLAQIIADQPAYVAHPYADKPCPIALKQPATLIIGPEGGFTDYEIDKLSTAGATAVTLGPRIMRVETAIPALISRLYPS